MNEWGVKLLTQFTGREFDLADVVNVADDSKSNPCIFYKTSNDSLSGCLRMVFMAFDPQNEYELATFDPDTHIEK